MVHTFDLKTTWPQKTPRNPRFEERGHLFTTNHEPRGHRHSAEMDELMIQWNGLPEDSEVSVYLPSLDAHAILAAAARRSGPQRLVKVNAHGTENTLFAFIGVSRSPQPLLPRLTDAPEPGGHHH